MVAYASLLDASTAVTTTNASNKCRYKTGKCTNTRSSKRNGQPHQLCLYHRDKANRIQRKFDRQKRQVARGSRTTNNSNTSSTIHGAPLTTSAVVPLLHHSHHLATVRPSASSPVMAFTVLTPRDVDFYSDSDASTSRFSSDSESSVVLEQMWNEEFASVDPHTLLLTPNSSSSVATTTTSPYDRNCLDGRLSEDEIDFLCSAIL